MIPYRDGARTECQDCGIAMVFSVDADEDGTSASWEAGDDSDPGCPWIIPSTGKMGHGEHTPDLDTVTS